MQTSFSKTSSIQFKIQRYKYARSQGYKLPCCSSVIKMIGETPEVRTDKRKPREKKEREKKKKERKRKKKRAKSDKKREIVRK